MATPPVHVTIEGTPNARRYLQTPENLTVALAPAIRMALQTRNVDDDKQTCPPPSFDAIERWIVATFPPRNPGLKYYHKDVFWGITQQVYPPVRWRKLSSGKKKQRFSDDQALLLDQVYEVLQAGRPVLVYLIFRAIDFWFLDRFFKRNTRQHDVLTRATYCAQPERDDTRMGPTGYRGLLWTGYDPASGVCTFLDPTQPRSWGYNGQFKIQDIGILTSEMPMAHLRCFEFYCHPGNVVKRRRLCSLFSPWREPPRESLVPNPFDECRGKEQKSLSPKGEAEEVEEDATGRMGFETGGAED